MTFLRTIQNFCHKKKLFSAGDAIVIGVSGGPDSMALLYALNALRPMLGLKLYVAHLNHGLRPQAVQEQRYVKKITSSIGVPFFTKTIHLAANQNSLEEVAREQRLKFFGSIAHKTQSRIVALGHHQDDLAETVLMRILRGTGLDGARSILPSRSMNGLVMIRPLLAVSRDEILAFLKAQKIKSCQDASNMDPKFLRNKIRLQLLPKLKKEYNPGIVASLANLSQHVGLAYDYIQRESVQAFQAASRQTREKNTLAFSRQALQRLHGAILAEVIRLAVEKVLGHTRKLTTAHIEEIIDLIDRRPLRSIVDLPNALSIQKKQDKILFSRSAR